MGGSDRTPDELLDQLESEGGDELAWWLREFRDEYEEGKSPKDVANELYFNVEEAPTDISLLLATSVIFGVLWEKNDQSLHTGEE